MKKIIMLLTVIAMLATSAVGVCAVENYEPTDGKYTITYNVGAENAGAYYGVVVMKEIDAALSFDDTDNILYIDQVTADEEGNITISEFATKGVAPGEEGFAEGTVYIGGESLGTATLIGYTKDIAEEEPETFTISGTVSGFSGSTLPTVTVTDGVTPLDVTVNEDGTFTVDVPVLEEGSSYTLTATKAGHLSYTKANITAAATVNPVLKAGDMNTDGIANVSDMGLIVDNYNAESGADGYTAAYDLNEDGIMNVSDMGLVVDNYNAEATVE